MPRITLPSALTLTVAALMLAPAAAQDARPRSTPASAAPAAGDLTLDFPGGTALEYINAIRKAQPDANIVVLGQMERIKMAAVQLKHVDVWSALRVLDQLPPMQGDIHVKVRLENIAYNPETAPVHAVSAEVQERGADPHELQTTVISMADLLGENLKPADALTAINTALELIKNAPEPAQIKFHEETGLLIARGSHEQIQNIRQVIEQLQERAGTLEIRKQREQAQRNADQNAAAAVSKTKDLATQLDIVTRQSTEWETRAQVLEREMDQISQRATGLEEELRQRVAERDALQRRLQDLQDKAKEPTP